MFAINDIPPVPKNVQLHVGMFHETLPVFLEGDVDPVRFANIDCDLYSSTRDVLTLLDSRIVPGSVLYFDEFYPWSGSGGEYELWREGEYLAVCEWAARRGRELRPLYRNAWEGISFTVTR